MTDATIRPDDIRWRVSNTWGPDEKKMGMLVGYVDARTVMDALDERDPEWSAVHGDPIIVGNEFIGVPCALTVNGVTRSDVGMPSSVDGLKGAYSDALKRAAIHHNVGRELYELPKIAVECELGRNGKVKAPKALPVFRNGRWEIDRHFGWVKYEREPTDEPDEQPERVAAQRRGGATPSYPAGSPPAPVPRTKGEAMDEYAAALRDEGMSFAQGNDIWKRHGLDRVSASVEDIMRIIADIRGIESSGQSATISAGATVPATDTPQSDGSVPDAATDPGSADDAVPPSASLEPGPAPTLDDVLAATGGELIPPKPGTDPYRALPAQEKAEARAYWQKAEAAA